MLNYQKNVTLRFKWILCFFGFNIVKLQFFWRKNRHLFSKNVPQFFCKIIRQFISKKIISVVLAWLYNILLLFSKVGHVVAGSPCFEKEVYSKFWWNFGHFFFWYFGIFFLEHVRTIGESVTTQKTCFCACNFWFACLSSIFMIYACNRVHSKGNCSYFPYFKLVRHVLAHINVVKWFT